MNTNKMISLAPRLAAGVLLLAGSGLSWADDVMILTPGAPIDIQGGGQTGINTNINLSVMTFGGTNNGGKLNNRGGFVDGQGAIGATLNNSGTLTNTDYATLNNQGGTNGGQGATLNNYGGLENDRYATLNNQGGTNGGLGATLNNYGPLYNRATLTNDGIINNSGYFEVFQGGVVNGTGTFTQTENDSRLRVDGTMTQSTIDIQEGFLDGFGTLTGAVTVGRNAILSPGNPGLDSGTYARDPLDIVGSLALNGTLNIEIASLTDFDRLFVSGGGVTVGDDSRVVFDFVSGFLPSADQSFQFLFSTGGIVGSLPEIAFADPLSGLDWSLTSVSGFNGQTSGSWMQLLFSDAQADPNGVPTPAPLTLLLAGLAPLGWHLRRNPTRG